MTEFNFEHGKRVFKNYKSYSAKIFQSDVYLTLHHYKENRKDIGRNITIDLFGDNVNRFCNYLNDGEKSTCVYFTDEYKIIEKK